jgi:copper chaperone NosL
VSKTSRVLLGIAAVGLLTLFVLPLWTIRLQAPQYPEGLGLHIRINTIEGVGPHDLGNINGLNHYIGMKRIEPDAIPELRYMPWIVGVLSLLGVAAAASGRRAALFTWFALLAVVALAGLVDFWLWEYDYGHNLDQEMAIIKVPGMNYQPPLIGSKRLLNFTASSWPAAGGWIAFACAALAGWAVVREIGSMRRSRRPVAVQDEQAVESATDGAKTRLARGAIALVAVCAAATACARAPEPIVAGDTCALCHMTVADTRFGAERITRRGQIVKYDAIECMARDLVDTESSDDDHSIWVVPFDAPGTLIPVADAAFYRSEAIHSPMGMGLIAISPQADPATYGLRPDERLPDWSAVRDLVRSAGPGGEGHAHSSGHTME